MGGRRRRVRREQSVAGDGLDCCQHPPTHVTTGLAPGGAAAVGPCRRNHLRATATRRRHVHVGGARSELTRGLAPRQQRQQQAREQPHGGGGRAWRGRAGDGNGQLSDAASASGGNWLLAIGGIGSDGCRQGCAATRGPLARALQHLPRPAVRWRRGRRRSWRRRTPAPQLFRAPITGPGQSASTASASPKRPQASAQRFYLTAPAPGTAPRRPAPRSDAVRGQGARWAGQQSRRCSLLPAAAARRRLSCRSTALSACPPCCATVPPQVAGPV